MSRVAIALAAFFLLATAQAAEGAYDPLGGGTTRLVLDKRFSAFLKRGGMRVTATAPARRAGPALSLPVLGGSLDPTVGKGEITQEGAIVLEGKGRRLPLRGITVKTNRSPLIAKVGGSQLKVATSAKPQSRREGFGVRFSAQELKLTAKVATRLNKKLRPAEPFAAGQPLGSLVSKTLPETITVLASGRATLVLDSALVDKLNDLFVSVNPIFPAEHLGPTFTLPIVVGGAIAPDAALGTLRSGGDIEFLQLGGGQIFWHELWLDLATRVDSAEADIQPAPPYPGKQGRVSLLDLGAGALSSDPAARTVTVSSAPLTLQASAAAGFNQAFAAGAEVFKPGEPFGTLTFTAQGQ